MRQPVHLRILLLALLLSSWAAHAQSSLTLTDAGSAGGNLSLNLSFSSGGASVAGVQWTFAVPASVTNVSATPGAALTAAGKSLVCAGSVGSYTCIASGSNANAIASGVIATITGTVSGTTAVVIATGSPMAVATDGTFVSISAAAGTVTLPGLTVISTTCNPTSLGPGIATNCTVTLSGAARSGGAGVTIGTAGNIAAATPFTIGVGLTSGSFAATAGQFSTSQSASVTASLNGTSSTASLSLVPPTVTGLQCLASSLTSNAGTTCTVTLNQAAPTGGFTVTITGGIANVLTVPGSVTVAGGLTTTTFTATAGLLAISQTITLGAGSQTFNISLVAPMTVTGLQCLASSLTSNTGTTCTVTMNQAAPVGGSTVTITGGIANVLTVPGSVTVTVGMSTATFAATAGSLTTSQTVTLGAGSQTFNISLVAPTLVTADSVLPASGSGLSQTFALQYSDSNGATDLSTAWVYVTAVFNANAANSCLAYYARATNTLYLLNDAGTAWGNGGAVGSAGSLSNSQCGVNLASSSVGVSGTHLTVNLAMTFAAGYAGAKNVYTYAASGSVNSGWQTRGTWTVAGPVTVTADSVLPASGSGLSQTFALQYSDSNGATDLSTAWLYVTAAFNANAANSCLMYYAQSTNTLYLLNDAGTAWGNGGAVGSAGTVSNSQCGVNLASSSVGTAGTHLTVNLALTFAGSYAGAKSVYTYAANGTVSSGWQNLGTWTVGAAATVTADSVTPSSGSGLSQTFALQYSDTNGGADISTAWLYVTASFNLNAANSCLMYYARASNTLYLLNDTGTVWGNGGAVGNAGSLSNSQCSVNLGSSSAAVSGTHLTLSLPITFAAGYAGAKNVYLYATNGSASSGWQALGTWTP